MKLRVKDIEKLRDFGFLPGSELRGKSPVYEEIFDGCEYMLPWWHKFQLDENGEPARTYDDDIPLCHAWVDTRGGENLLWFDVTPECTYHACMDELDLVTGTVFMLTEAGLLEFIP